VGRIRSPNAEGGTCLIHPSGRGKKEGERGQDHKKTEGKKFAIDTAERQEGKKDGTAKRLSPQKKIASTTK